MRVFRFSLAARQECPGSLWHWPIWLQAVAKLGSFSRRSSSFTAGGFRWRRGGGFGIDEAEGGQEEFAVGGAGGEGEDGFADGTVEQGRAIDADEFLGFARWPGGIDGEEADDFGGAVVWSGGLGVGGAEADAQGDAPIVRIFGEACPAELGGDFHGALGEASGMRVEFDRGETMSFKLQGR